MASVDDILRATLSYTLEGGDTGMMVFNYVVISGSESNYATLANGIENALEVAFSDLEVETAQDINPIELELSEWNFSQNQWDGKSAVASDVPDGALGGATAPHGIACVARFITETRRRQGRKFYPGIVESHTTGSALSAGYLSAAVLTTVDLNDDIVAGGATVRPCVFNDTVGNPLFETHAEFVQTSHVNTNVGYQRRRQPGAGI